MGAQLGCGEHRVMVAERGAAVPFDELQFSSLTYGRVLDDMSSASVTVPADSTCCGVLGNLREWRHELWIYRDDEEVWRGPVTPQPTYTEADVTVPAKDLFAWFERRATDDQAPGTHTSSFSRLFVYRNVDLSFVFAEVLNRARRRDPHPALIVESTASGVVTPEFHIDPFQRPRAADVCRSLAKMGVDFTLIGNRILIGSPEVAAGDLTYLTSDVVSGVSVTPLPTASEVVIIGGNSGAAGGALAAIVGYGGAAAYDVYKAQRLPIDPVIGLVIEQDNMSDLNTQDAVTRAARTRYDFYRGEPLTASFALDPQAPVSFDQLIPGAKVRLDIGSTCRTLSGTYRLTKVDVSVSDSAETVSATVAPLGSLA